MGSMMRCSSGAKTLLVLLLTLGAGVCSSWMAAALFDRKTYGSCVIPIALGVILTVSQALVMELVQTPAEVLAVPVFEREEIKQKIRNEIHRKRLERVRGSR